MLISQRSARAMMRVTPEPKPGDGFDAFAKVEAQLAEAMKARAKKEKHKPLMPPSAAKAGKTPDRAEQIKARRAEIIAFIKASQPVTSEEVAAHIGLSRTSANSDLAILRAEGKLASSRAPRRKALNHWTIAERAGE